MTELVAKSGDELCRAVGQQAAADWRAVLCAWRRLTLADCKSASTARRGSLTDPLLHAHTSQPGSSDGIRRDSNDSSSGFPGAFGSTSGDSHDRQASVASNHSPLSPVGNFPVQNSQPYSLANYSWPTPAGGATQPDYGLNNKRKSAAALGMDESDPKRRTSVASLDGTRLSNLSLDAERRSSISSAGWSTSTSGSGSGPFPWAPQPPRPAGQFAFNAPGLPQGNGTFDQLNAYNFGACDARSRADLGRRDAVSATAHVASDGQFEDDGRHDARFSRPAAVWRSPARLGWH